MKRSLGSVTFRRVAVGGGRCRGGGFVSAEDSGANQADGDETDRRDGGDDDEQDAFSAEGHGGEAFGRDVSGQRVHRNPECDDSGMRRRKTPTGSVGRPPQRRWGRSGSGQTRSRRPPPRPARMTRLRRMTTTSTRAVSIRRQMRRPVGPVSQAVRIAIPMVV